MEEFVLEILKGVVALIVGLTAGLTVAASTSRRSADLEREKWKADLALEHEKIEAEDERRWHAERRRLYSEFLNVASPVVQHYAQVVGVLELERMGIARPDLWPDKFDTSGIGRPLEEIRLIGSTPVPGQAGLIKTEVDLYWIAYDSMTIGERTPEKEQSLANASERLRKRIGEFTYEARKELGLEPASKRLDDVLMEEKAREFLAKLEVDEDQGPK